MALIYQLAEGPEVICAQMLQDCAKQALEKLEEKSDPQEAPRKRAGGVVGPRQQPLTPPPPAATLSPPCPSLSLRLHSHCCHALHPHVLLLLLNNFIYI